MIVGFTGTQVGMTDTQRSSFRSYIVALHISEFHHGDCIGADEQAHKTVRKRTKALIHLHPPTYDAKRAFCKADVIHPAFDYLTRNRHIVEAVNRMIATPSSKEEELRSGTWATVRYARKLRRPVTLIYPDGSVVEEKGVNMKISAKPKSLFDK